MFALEIAFNDGAEEAQMVFVRRPQAIIGASEIANVIIEDFKEVGCQLRLVRDLGRRFRCKPLSSDSSASIELSSLLEQVFDGETTLEVGRILLQITTLDVDLAVREQEPPDRAGVRVLRQACATPSPVFPALLVGNASSGVVVSFVPDQPVLVGRSKQCGLRLDSSDISSKHARIGYESGLFWVEDLGSTNGTFVDEQQISGRVSIAAGKPIMLGRDVSITGIVSEAELERGGNAGLVVNKKSQAAKYPVLVSASEVARPARVVIAPGASLSVGRDPTCELWLGAPHVSRKHCVFTMTPTGLILVNDYSTNGTQHDRGVLRRGDVLQLRDRPAVFDFGGGVTVGICFKEEEEETFMASQGSAHCFKDLSEQGVAATQEAMPTQTKVGLRLSQLPGMGGVFARVERFRKYYASADRVSKILVLGMVIGVSLVALFALILILSLIFRS